MNISSDTSLSQFPHRHISIRVPWHDNGWIGGICKAPGSNTACLILRNIRERKQDELEVVQAGKLINEVPQKNWPPCVTENATFMAPFEFTRTVEHPYQSFSTLHQNLLPTHLRYPSYSAAAIPFRRMHSDFAWELAQEQNLNVTQEREPIGDSYLKNWVQNHENQKEILDSFFNSIKLDSSLCFFYAKQTPLADDERRVIVGVGQVKYIGSAIEYDCKKKDGFRSYIWERTIQHSIRPGFSDGFLLPYKQILEIASQDKAIDPAEFVAFAPDDRRIEFSYGTEHVTHDAAIAALVSCRGAIEKSRSLVTGKWDIVLDWIDDRLTDLWKLRGPFPGLGSALRAFGLECGSSLAYELADHLAENEDPWPLMHQIFNDPSKYLSQQIARFITPTIQKKWIEITQNKPDRLALLKLLARFEINSEQAIRFYSSEQRNKDGINCTDEKLLRNPYLIYEQDRTSFGGISIFTVDRGLFPDPIVREAHPLPEPSRLEGQYDPRRVRALAVATLEDATTRGHTLLPRNQVVLSINELGIEPKCPVDGDLLDAIISALSPEIVSCELGDKSAAYQLQRFAEIKKLISTTVQKRLKGKRLNIEVDWRQKLDEKLSVPRNEKEEQAREEQARKEKAAALKELAESRISVLIGPAGTGKTTLLSILCDEPSIARNGILLLAPTGKARVQLLRSTNIQAQTLAQFLYKHDRYDGRTSIYHLSDIEKVDVGKTVIIDEASMLTEEQLGAALDAIKGVERLILVGDPSQLPPIGAGRPFVDIVKLLAPDHVETMDIRVAAGYAELTVRRRQIGHDREDLQLAEWFSGRPLGPAEDEIRSRIAMGEHLHHLRFRIMERC